MIFSPRKKEFKLIIDFFNIFELMKEVEQDVIFCQNIHLKNELFDEIKKRVQNIVVLNVPIELSMTVKVQEEHYLVTSRVYIKNELIKHFENSFLPRTRYRLFLFHEHSISGKWWAYWLGRYSIKRGIRAFLKSNENEHGWKPFRTWRTPEIKASLAREFAYRIFKIEFKRFLDQILKKFHDQLANKLVNQEFLVTMND